MKILLLLCLIQVLQHTRGIVLKNNDDSYSQDESFEASESIRNIEEEVSNLNKTGDVRDKRALGILLQGIMEALGYSVSPIQIAAIPNSPGQINARPSSGMMMASTVPMNSSASAPRQRETLRFTGVLNFGNNLNTTNLVNHLAQYEQLFHGNRTTSAPTPSSSPSPSSSAEYESEENLDIDPREPTSEPLLVKIPLPIVPNLPPPQQPLTTPEEEEVYREEEYAGENSEEYHGTEDDAGKKGNHEEETDNYTHSEEYEKDHEESYGPKNRNYKSRPNKNYEKEYKKNKNVVNYSIENKEIRDPSEVSEEVPGADSKFRHSVYSGEPDWKEKHSKLAYKLAAEQEARVEALAEENAEREKEKSRDYELDEDDVKFHSDREKEINDRYESQRIKYESREKPLFFDEDDEETSGKKSFDPDDSEEEDEFEEKSIGSKKEIEQKEETSKAFKQEKKPTNRILVKELNENNGKSVKQSKTNTSHESNNDRRQKIQEKLPISYDREKLRQDPVIRDSYGESLEKPGHGVDDRVAGYFTMFKNPHTGVYDPNRIKQLNPSELINGFEKIQKEYGSARSKYEEYEINDDENDDEAEHRAEDSSRRTLSDDEDDDKTQYSAENNSRKTSLDDEADGEAEHRTENNTKNTSSDDETDDEAENTTDNHAETTLSEDEDVEEEENNQNEYLNDSKKVAYGSEVKKPDCKNCTTEKPKESSKEEKPSRKFVSSRLTPPKKSEDPVGYGPYYTSVLYEPREYDQGIISRLTSHDRPTVVRFNGRRDQKQSSSHRKTEKDPHSTIRPTAGAIPEKLTVRSLVQEVETKEIRAWPAPFDYEYDNSEKKNVVMKKIPQTISEGATQNLPSVQPRPFKINVPDHSYDEARSLPPKEAANRVRLLLKEHENNAYNAEKENYRVHPKNYQNVEKLPQHARLIR